jgi:hypothetical protein
MCVGHKNLLLYWFVKFTIGRLVWDYSEPTKPIQQEIFMTHKHNLLIILSQLHQEFYNIL